MKKKQEAISLATIKFSDYKPLPDSITIRESNIDGLGLIAKEDIPKGTFLGTIHIPNMCKSGEFIRTPLGGFGNHSENPSCNKFKFEHNNHWGITTKQHIYKGGEITWKYTLYEIETKK